VNASTSGITRTIEITGLSNTQAYVFRVLCSVGSGVAGSHTVDLGVSGATSGGTTILFNEKGNTSYIDWMVKPTGGKVTLGVRKRQGVASINVFEIIYKT